MGPYKQKGFDPGEGTGMSKTKKQARKENRADRKATRKSEGSVARQAIRRGVSKVKSKVAEVKTIKANKKKIKEKAIANAPGTSRLEKKLNVAGARQAAKDKARKERKSLKKAIKSGNTSGRKIQAPKAKATINTKGRTVTPKIAKAEFGKVFAMERAAQGAGKTFKYGGKLYSTDTREDRASRKYKMPPKMAGEYQKRQAQRALNQRKK